MIVNTVIFLGHHHLISFLLPNFWKEYHVLSGAAVGESAQCFSQMLFSFHSVLEYYSSFFVHSEPTRQELSPWAVLPCLLFLHFLLVMILCIFQRLLQIAWALFPRQWDFLLGFHLNLCLVLGHVDRCLHGILVCMFLGECSCAFISVPS